MACADDLLFLVTSSAEPRRTHKDLCAAFAKWGLGFRIDRLCLWSNIRGGAVCVGGSSWIRKLAWSSLGPCWVVTMGARPGTGRRKLGHKFWAIRGNLRLGS